MPVKKKKGGEGHERSYPRMTGRERDDVGRMLDKGKGCREIARELGKSESTVCRWVDAVYNGMSNLDLRRKVGYKRRKAPAVGCAARHSAHRSHAAFLALPEDERADAWEMDTVGGRASDTACLLTPLRGSARLQLVIPIAAQDSGGVLSGLGLVSAALGGNEGMRRVLGTVLTDNGGGFSDEAGIATLIGEHAGETRLFYCDPCRPGQKGSCDKNHVEIRKLLPKGCGISFDLLTREDCALVMSQVNSKPRDALTGLKPASRARHFRLAARIRDQAKAFG